MQFAAMMIRGLTGRVNKYFGHHEDARLDIIAGELHQRLVLLDEMAQKPETWQRGPQMSVPEPDLEHSADP